MFVAVIVVASGDQRANFGENKLYTENSQNNSRFNAVSDVILWNVVWPLLI